MIRRVAVVATLVVSAIASVGSDGAVPVSAAIQPPPGSTGTPFEPIPGSTAVTNATTAAYNPVRGEYLFVTDEFTQPNSIVASVVKADGTVVVPRFVIDVDSGVQALGNVATNNVDVVFNPKVNEFLVTYTKFGPRAGLPSANNNTQRVMAQRVSATGARIGVPTPIDAVQSTDFRCAAHYHDVAVDPASGEYIVAYAVALLFATFDACEDSSGKHKTTVMRMTSALVPGPRTDLPGRFGNGNNTWTAIAAHPTNGDVLIGRLDDLGGRFTLVSSTFATKGEQSVDNRNVTPGSFPARVDVAVDPASGKWMTVTRGSQRTQTMVLNADGTIAEPAAIRFQQAVDRLEALGDGVFVTAGNGAIGQLDLRGEAVSQVAMPRIDGTITAAFDVSAGADGRFLATGRRTGGNTRRPIAVELSAVNAAIVPIAPVRLADTRKISTAITVDNDFQQIGPVAGGSELVLKVAGRGGVPVGAAAAMLNIAAAGASTSGFVTAYPCSSTRPTTSNLNFSVGAPASAGAFAALSSEGTTCLFVSTTIELIVDVNGFVPSPASINPIVPERFLETRPGQTVGTVDGKEQGRGTVPAGVVELEVAGRGSVPADASAVMINITAVRPAANLFATAFPCGATQPTAANLNAAAGSATNNLALARIGDGGKVCLFTSAATDLIVDVSAFVPAVGSLVSINPQRLIESRPGESTIDGASQFGARLKADSTAGSNGVAGRGSVSSSARGVMLNVAAINPSTGGFITVYPCGTRPNTASVNYAAGGVTSNAVFVSLSSPDGWICVYTSAETHVAVDVVGYTVDG